MLLKDIYRTFAVIWGIVFIGALGVVIYRHELTFRDWLETVWWFSMAITMIGAFARSGALGGVRIAAAEGVIKTSHDPHGFVREFNRSASTGFAFWTIVILAAGPIFGVSLAILHFKYS